MREGRRAAPATSDRQEPPIDRLARRVLQRLPRPETLPYVFGVLATVVVLVVLFVPRPIGLADNGDAVRLPCRMGLAPDYKWGQTQYFTSVTFKFHHGQPPKGLNCHYQSTAEWPLHAAQTISGWVGGHALDTRVVGVLYALLFGIAIGCLVAGLPMRSWVRLVGGVVLVVVFADVAFVSYFSTAYSEPMGFVGLLLTVGLLFIGWRRREAPGLLWLLATTGVAAATVLAKPQYGPAALMLAVAVAARPIGTFGRSAGRVLPTICALLLLLAGNASVHSSPRQFQLINHYNAFFTELLGHSPNPRADLKAFHLDPSLASYAGTTYFDHPSAQGSPHFQGFYDKVQYRTLIEFYAARPARAWQLFARGARAGADPRTDYLGMFPYEGGTPKVRLTCRLCVASSVGRVARPAAPVVMPMLWLAAMGVGLVEVFNADRERRALAGGVIIADLTAAMLFFAAVVGDGIEFTKHLMGAVEAGWLALALAAALVALRIADRNRVWDT